ncbi:unnamed protein product [Sphagnum jensenii]|uniref:Uncharacterized protein n=1 Tax=Sphagnum jensenii TaxID=128206 RepID=A0ABP0XBP9_9BRYO
MHEWCEDVHYWKLLSIIEQPQVRHCRSVAVTEEDKKITEHFRTWNIESTDLIKRQPMFFFTNNLYKILPNAVPLPVVWLDPEIRFGGA